LFEVLSQLHEVLERSVGSWTGFGLRSSDTRRTQNVNIQHLHFTKFLRRVLTD